MARIKKGIRGEVSGKVGNVVGATWNGIPYIRSMPTNWIDPKTENQVKQRSKFLVTMNFLRTASKLVRIGFQSQAQGRMTAFNAAMSYNMKNAVKPTEEGFELDFEKVMISQGTLDGTSEVKVKLEEGEVLFEWDTNVVKNGKKDDMAMVMIYNTQRCRGQCDINAGKRKTGEASLYVPKDWAGDEIVAFLAFRDNDATEASNSIFAGKWVLQPLEHLNK